MSYSDSRRDHDHIGNFNFIVEIDGISVGAFKAVDGLNAEVTVIEYQDGNDHILRKRPGRVKYGDITLKRGFIEDRKLFEWFMAVANGKVQRKSVSICLLNNDGKEVVRFNLFECFPSKWVSFTLDGKSDDTAVEEITFSVEKWERVSSETANVRDGFVR